MKKNQNPIQNYPLLVTRYWFPRASARGDIAVYMALVVLIIITSSVLVFMAIISRQIKATRSIADSERALYAANTGLEQGLYVLANSDDFTFQANEVIDYPEDGTQASYSVKATALEPPGSIDRQACILSEGTYRSETRRIRTGPADCPT